MNRALRLKVCAKSIVPNEIFSRFLNHNALWFKYVLCQIVQGFFKPLRKTKHMTFHKTIDRHWKDNNPVNDMIFHLFAPPPLWWIQEFVSRCDICDILCDNCGTALRACNYFSFSVWYKSNIFSDAVSNLAPFCNENYTHEFYLI